MKDTQDILAIMADIGARAKAAAAELAFATAERKHVALIGVAEAVWTRRAEIIEANARDLDFGRDKGLSDAMMDRLMLDETRIRSIVDGLRTVAEQADPVGQIISEWDMASGLHIQRVRTPLGVIGVIYESRPNVTADAGALCLKAGNAVILRGGKGLVGLVQREARVPVFAHLEGIVHIYVDKSADPEKVLPIVLNAKTRRTGICGAAECLLIHRDVAGTIGQDVIRALLGAGVEVRADQELATISGTTPASEDDWGREFLDMKIAAKTVDTIDEAIAHIRQYGSDHTDCILAEDATVVARFFQRLDSAILMHNASTQFADGGEFGMGAEIGIATGKMHARGPVGAEQLTSFKYLVTGDGAVRA